MTRTDWLAAALGAVWLGGFALLAAGPEGRHGSTAVASVESGALVGAARDGDVEQVRALLSAGADIDAREADGATALHWAVYNEDHALVRLLLQRRADPLAANQEGSTPLALAAINGDAAALRLLLDAGADVNTTLPHGETALMLAARTGSDDAVALLLARGAEVDATEELRGTTALMWAAANGNTPVVRQLIAHGADVSKTSAPASAGRGAYLAPSAQSRIRSYRIGYLDDSVVGREVSQVERLRARASLLDNDASEELAALLRQQAEEQGEEASDRSPFDVILDEDPESAEAAGAPAPSPPGARQRGGGLTALVFAAREGDPATVRVLLDAGADVNQTTNYGWTPLLAATQNRYYRLAAYLLEQGADPNIADRGGWNPLYIAADNRNIEGGDYPTRRPDMDHLDYIRLLLAHGADPNLRMASSTETRTVFTNQWLREEGATPFLRAAQSGDLALMRLLLQYGADPHIATDDGVTPLMAASGIGWVEGLTHEWSPAESLETVRFLLDLGADANAHDTVDQRTALMGAAHKGRPEVVQLLVDHGADLAAQDIGSRDSVHKLYGARWDALDYADGLVRVGVQSASPHPETAALLRRLMTERGLPVPPEGRTLDSICIVEVCQPPT